MITTRVAAKEAIEPASVLVVPVIMTETGAIVDETVPAHWAGQSIAREYSSAWCQHWGLSDTAGSSALLIGSEGAVLLVSVGPSYQGVENFRLAGAAAFKRAGGLPIAVLLPVGLLEDLESAAAAVTEGCLLASYNYKTADLELSLSLVALAGDLPSIAQHDAVVAGLGRGVTVATGANWARRLIDTPPSDMTPKELARSIEERLMNDPHTDVRIWNEPTIRDERLGGVLGVSRGSAEPARVVFATYAPENATAHVVLVGKGVTFDSGGLAIKPLASMEAMKGDMSGAAVVMAATSIVAQLRLDVRVTAIAPLVENMSGERAIKPSDVVTIRNGVTVEVLNPDAEGRLILADALSLAVEMQPDLIIDVATLTGAQQAAFADEIGTVFATSDDLTSHLMAAGERAGESLWPMPLFDKYERHIESDIADLRNKGKIAMAGSILAGLFLRHFTGGLPWAHLDIAGPMKADTSRDYVSKGMTAFSTRTLVEFLSDVASRGR